LLTKAAEQGNVDAQFGLGAMYTNGQGVAKDERTAVLWYTKAAEQGDAGAQYTLGVMYANGQGVAKDKKTAALWQANIGRSLSLGDFVLINAARTQLGDIKPNSEMYLDMMQGLVAVESGVLALAAHPSRVVFGCSGPDDEVQYVWAPLVPNT
jgi:hypothetical protein